MLIVFQIPVQNLSDGFLSRHLQNGAVIIDHVDNSDSSWFLCELSNDIFGILPPLYLAL